MTRFLRHLEAQGHVATGHKIRPAGEYPWPRIDVLDVTAPELHEAKGTTTRDSIRLAIGQLLDYDTSSRPKSSRSSCPPDRARISSR